MSKDLYTSEIDSQENGYLIIDLLNSGSLRIVSARGETYGRFTLTPTPEGFSEAESIIKALQDWTKLANTTMMSNCNCGGCGPRAKGTCL